MIDSLLTGGGSQPWLWTPVVFLAAGLLREIVRLVAFIWGMSIALRGSDGPLRVKLLDAYARCAPGGLRLGLPVRPGGPSPKRRGQGA